MALNEKGFERRAGRNTRLGSKAPQGEMVNAASAAEKFDTLGSYQTSKSREKTSMKAVVNGSEDAFERPVMVAKSPVPSLTMLTAKSPVLRLPQTAALLAASSSVEKGKESKELDDYAASCNAAMETMKANAAAHVNGAAMKAMKAKVAALVKGAVMKALKAKAAASAKGAAMEAMKAEMLPPERKVMPEQTDTLRAPRSSDGAIAITDASQKIAWSACETEKIVEHKWLPCEKRGWRDGR